MSLDWIGLGILAAFIVLLLVFAAVGRALPASFRPLPAFEKLQARHRARRRGRRACARVARDRIGDRA